MAVMVIDFYAMTHTSFKRFSLSVNLSDVFDSEVVLGGQASMYAKDFVSNNVGQWKQAKEFTAQVTMKLRVLAKG